jgi:signal transduction histidine kinase
MDAILRDWRKSIREDASLSTNRVLPRTQLNDHVPDVLLAFLEAIRGTDARDDEPPEGPNPEAATAHGLHRWQQGYDLHEVTRELGLLNVRMVEELDRCASTRQNVSPEVMAHVRRLWAITSAASVEESTSQYFQLQRMEAAGHVKDLESALAQVKDLEQQRAELWRQIAHDLHGNIGVVATAARGLGMPHATGATRERFISILDRNITSLRHLLSDVTSLTRLQAGHETREVQRFDAGAELTELCEGMQSFADERRLYLRHLGPTPFMVTSDLVKLRRLVQNLVLNALKYTKVGGVTVSWGEQGPADDERWLLSVADTGPGLHAGPGTPLAAALQDATQLTSEAEGERPDEIREDPRPVSEAPGEGIGLSIVKRLADLLNASVQLESSEATGTIFKVLFPKHYDM